MRPPWKKRPHAASKQSSPLPLQTRSGKGAYRLVGELWNKITKRSPAPVVAHSLSSTTTSPSPSPSVKDPTKFNHPNDDTSPHTASESVSEKKDQDNSVVAKAKPPDQWQSTKGIIDKVKAIPVAGRVPPDTEAIFSAANDQLVQGIPGAMDAFSKILAPLETFNRIATGLSDLHPYAKAVLSIFTYASNMILAQAQRDDAVSALLEKISEVYSLMTEDERLRVIEIESMQELFGKMARQIQQCADFIIHYSETKSAWERLAKSIVDVRKKTDTTIQDYNLVLDTLMQRFRDGAVRGIFLDVRDIDVNIHHLVKDLELKDMVHVHGAGRDTSKCCLPGTRERILSEIKAWVDKTGKDEPGVFWLSGTAGKGKSAIAHTIANWFHERGGPGACFCFDRTQTELHKKMFTTIARDLADRDPNMRRTLAHAVRDDNNLRHTHDIMMQWTKLILPVAAASKTVDASALIVVDALDESDDAHSRKQILHMLSGKLEPKLPANVRVLITSRPLDDIRKSLDGTSHVHHVSLDDPSHVPVESSQHDIQLYIFDRLHDLHRDKVIDDSHFKTLARKSHGLFQWARLACEYIEGTNKAGVEPMDQCKDLIAGTSESDSGIYLLDNMYRRILRELMPENKKAISRVRSVMGQILASSEPLSMAALIAIRQQFPGEAAEFNVKGVIEPLGSLLTGTADSHTPIRPLHASFYDFLTDESRSKEFFIDVSLVQRGLAFASLRVMKKRLRFNICSLRDSYLPNSAISDLEKRVKDSISPQLSYSCRFFGKHVRSTPFEQELAEELRIFFNGECLLFWLEALALMHDLSGSIPCLSSITDWLTDECMDISDAIKDTQRFVASFGGAILHSTPHLYLSALPFAPTSTIFTKFATTGMFPRIPRIVAGDIQHWPMLEKIIHTNSFNNVVAISPDGNRIVSGSEDKTIRIWDAHTGEALGIPMRGHSRGVRSVAISSDGTRIVSGSLDHTIRIWDAHTSQALGVPLQGHTDVVTSVVISRNGNRIVSGSRDKTIRIWDAHTGKALGVPLRGHADMIMSVAISSDGHRIVSGSEDKTIRIWDAHTGETLGVGRQGHTDRVRTVALSPDGARIVSGSADRTIRLWDAYTGKALGVPLRGHTQAVRSIAISSDGHHIVSASDQDIRAWDAHTGKALGVPLQRVGVVISVAISPDGNHIISGSHLETIKVWDARYMYKGLGAPLQGSDSDHTAAVSSVAISPDGNRIVSGSHNNTIRIWDAHTGKALGVPLRGHTAVVNSVAISSDGNRIVSGSLDRTIRIWDAHSGEALGVPLRGHTDIVKSVAISSDGNRIASGSYDRTIRVWSAHTGEALGGLGGLPPRWHTAEVNSVVISPPDGHRIVSCSNDGTIRVWDAHATDSKVLVEFPQEKLHSIHSIAISPDGNRIVSCSDVNKICVWDAHTGEALGELLSQKPIKIGFHVQCAISPDGNHIIACADDKTIRMWDAHTLEPLSGAIPLQGHTDLVRSVAISESADGNCIVSHSSDGIRVWNMDSFLNPPAICFSPNSTHTLCSTSSFLENSDRMLAAGTPLTSKDGWIVGPEGRLLLWIPISLYPVMYGPLAGNTLVIPNNALQIDLSRFAHGSSWDECRALDTWF